MANVFEYQSLPAGDYIRVLILAPGKDDDPLAGELKVIHLSSRKIIRKLRETWSKAKVAKLTPDTPYEAISYVWGSDKKDHKILLSGKTHHITANLKGALDQCRLPDQPRALWADSICIDQENLIEKNHQVHMMGCIYASSQQTLICLGKDPSNRDHAQATSTLVSDVNEMIQRFFQSPNFWVKYNSFPRPLPNDPLVDDSRWQSVDILFRDPWFGRGWIVQEAALAREARILWAGCNIALLDLLRVDEWYFARAIYLVDQLDHRRSSTLIPNLLRRTYGHKCPAESKAFQSNKHKVHDLGILQALQFAKDLGLSNPRDRIYAFTGLPFVRNPVPDLRPNYEQSHLELYQDFAIKYLEKTRDFDILSYVESKGRNEASVGTNLGSSWVPRWDDRRGGRYAKTNGNFNDDQVMVDEDVVLHGENGTPALLRIRAVIIGPIRQISRRFHRSMKVEDLATVWSQFAKGAGSASTEDTSSTACDSLCFLKALTTGFYSFKDPGEDRAATLKSYASFLQTKEQEKGSQTSPRVSPEIQLCHRRLVNLAHDSRMFALERGNFGIGPPHMEDGDVCAFVFRVSLPLILRKSPGEGPGHYHVIGSAFVVSMVLDKMGLPSGLNQVSEWLQWDLLRGREGWWTDGGLEVEKIVLH